MGEARASACPRSGFSSQPGRSPDDAHTSQSPAPEIGAEMEQTSRARDPLEVISAYVDAGLAQPPTASERGDPAGSFLPLVSQKV